MRIKSILSTLIFGLSLTACNSGGVDSSNQSMEASSISSNKVSATLSEPAYDANLSDQVITATFEESSTKTMYVGTLSNGLFISNDLGKTWIHKNNSNGLPGNSVTGIAGNGKNIYLTLGTSDGSTIKTNVAVSHDNGETWSVINSANPGCTNCNFTSVYATESTVYLGSDKTVFENGTYKSIGAYISISHDNGVSWTATALDTKQVTSVYSLNVNESNIYFLDKEARYNGILNMAFIRLTINNNVANISANHSFWVSNTGIPSEILNDIAIVDGSIYVATSSGVAVSSNKGNNFSVKYDGLDSYDIYSLSGNSNMLVAGTDNGYAVSYDHGNSWNAYAPNDFNGLPSQNVVSVFVGSTLTLLGTDQGVMYANNINELNLQNNPDKSSVNSMVGNATSLYLSSTYESGIQIYDSSKATATTNGYNGTSTGINSNYANDVFISGSNIYIATVAGLSISKDNGQTWSYKDSSNGLPIGYVSSVFAVGSNIYAGTYTGGLAISNDGGNSWHTVNHNNGLHDNNDIVYSVSVVNDMIYVGTSDGVSLSSDNGKTWSHHLDGVKIKRLFATSRSVYAIASDTNAIYISPDYGNSWSKKSDNLSNKQPKAIFVSAGVIYLGLSDGTVAISLDNGEHFSIKSIPNTTLSINSIYQKNGKLLVSNNSGVFSN